MVIQQQIRARAFALAKFLTLPVPKVLAQRKPYGDGDDDDKSGTGSLATMIQRAGTAEAAANELWRDNYQLREQRRKLRDEVAELKAKQPVDGSLVLTKEQAAEWEAYLKLGKPAEIEKAVTDGKAAAEAVAKQERANLVTKAAKDLNYNPEVLTQLTEMRGLALTSQTVKVNGADQTVHYVTEPNGQPLELSQYAATHWAAFLPSLQVAGQGQQGQQGQAQGQQGAQGAQQGQAQQGQPWLQQGAQGGQPQTGNPVADMVAKTMAARNGAEQQGQGQGQQGQQAQGQQGHIPGGPGAPT